MTELTNEQLAAMGYVIEVYDREDDNTLNWSMYYSVTAPDGQLIAEDLTSATSAYEWARWHAAKQP